MEKTYNGIVAENKALKAEIQKLKMQLDDERAFTDALTAKYGIPHAFDRLRTDMERIHDRAIYGQGCKVISMNH